MPRFLRAAMTSYRLISFENLHTEHLSFWEVCCNSSLNYCVPFFHPAFANHVAQVRDDASVIVGESNGRVVSLLPVQLENGKKASPIGGRLNDMHGVISNDIKNVNVAQMSKDLGGLAFSFHALTQKNAEFDAYCFDTFRSPYIDLSKGWRRYFRWLKRRSTTIRRHPQKARRMESDLGPMSFEFDCRDFKVLDQVIEMKRDHYRRTNLFDLFTVDWTRALVDRVFNNPSDDFAGVLSVLRSGEKLVAGHFGIRTKTDLFYWFPDFDNNFARYSPGTMLLLELCQAAAAFGLQRIHLGHGSEAFKSRFANRAHHLSCGCVSTSGFSQALQQQTHMLKKWIKSSRFHPITKRLIRTLNPAFGASMYR